MTQYGMVKAERISKALEDEVGTLLDKLCEGEPDTVRAMAMSMFVVRVGFAAGKGQYFVLPPLDEC